MTSSIIFGVKLKNHYINKDLEGNIGKKYTGKCVSYAGKPYVSIILPSGRLTNHLFSTFIFTSYDDTTIFGIHVEDAVVGSAVLLTNAELNENKQAHALRTELEKLGVMSENNLRMVNLTADFYLVDVEE